MRANVAPGASARLLRVAAVVVCLSLLGASGTSATVRPAVTTPSDVRQLAADGVEAAAVVDGPPAHAFVWSARTGSVTQLRATLCGSCTPRSSVFGVDLGAGRAAWVASGGGNTYETHVLTATTRSPRAVPLASGLAADEPAGRFAGNVRSDGGVVVFNVYDRCGDASSAHPCPAGSTPGTIVHAEVWRFPGGGSTRCPTALAPTRGCRRLAAADGELSILALGGGRIAARTDTGTVRLLSVATGASTAEFPYPPGAVRAAVLDAHDLAILRDGFLDVYSIGSTGAPRTVRLPRVATYGPANPAPDAAGAAPPTAVPKLTLEDVDSGYVVYAVGRRVHLVRCSDGTDTVVAHTATGPAHAQLERRGLFVSSARRISFTPVAEMRRILVGHAR